MKHYERVRAPNGLTVPLLGAGSSDAAPTSGELAIYGKTDGYVYGKNPAGSEFIIGPTPPDDTGWQNVTFLGAWTNFETGPAARTCQVRRVGKAVKYRGIMKGGAVGGGGVCFSVASQFRPDWTRAYSGQYWPCVSNTAFGALAMGNTAGQFECVVGSNVWFDISGLRYFVE